MAAVPRERTCFEELEVIDQPRLLTLFVGHIPHFLSQKTLAPPPEQEAAYAELVEPQEVDCIACRQRYAVGLHHNSHIYLSLPQRRDLWM